MAGKGRYSLGRKRTAHIHAPRTTWARIARLVPPLDCAVSLPRPCVTFGSSDFLLGPSGVAAREEQKASGEYPLALTNISEWLKLGQSPLLHICCASGKRFVRPPTPSPVRPCFDVRLRRGYPLTATVDGGGGRNTSIVTVTPLLRL